MNQIRSGGATSAAVLAGSLAAFPLLDVLSLLARTSHSGELHVVGDGVEARLWVDGGQLVDRPGSAGDRLFELASLEDAWFTVTGAAPTDHGTEELERFDLEPLIEQVRPQVAEWQTLVRTLPFGALARMSSQMQGPEVQIRSDQWRILSLIGAGRPVHEVVDVADGRPLETLRLVQELAEQQLISIELPGPEPKPVAAGTSPEVVVPDVVERPRAVASAPAGWRRTAGATTVAATSRRSAREQPETPAAEASAAEAPAPAAAEAAQSDPPAEDDVKRRTGRLAYMPPPLSPDRWRPGTEPSSVTARPRAAGTQSEARKPAPAATKSDG